MPKSINRTEYSVLRNLLREKRIASGWTQVDVSQRLGRSQSFISDVERGVRRVDVLELHDMCLLFDTALTKFCAEFERRIATPTAAARTTKRQTRSKAGSSRSSPPKRRSTRP